MIWHSVCGCREAFRLVPWVCFCPAEFASMLEVPPSHRAATGLVHTGVSG